MTPQKAFAVLNEYQEIGQNLRKKEEDMKFGFNLFQINYITSQDLEYVEKEINNLKDIWKKRDEWD